MKGWLYFLIICQNVYSLHDCRCSRLSNINSLLGIKRRGNSFTGIIMFNDLHISQLIIINNTILIIKIFICKILLRFFFKLTDIFFLNYFLAKILSIKPNVFLKLYYICIKYVCDGLTLGPVMAQTACARSSSRHALVLMLQHSTPRATDKQSSHTYTNKKNTRRTHNFKRHKHGLKISR